MVTLSKVTATKVGSAWAVQRASVPCLRTGINTLTPSPVAATFGVAQTLYPSRGYNAILALLYARLSAAGVGAEAITVRIQTAYPDSRFAPFLWSTVVAPGGSYDLTGYDLVTLMINERVIDRILVDMRSSINNSTATGSFYVAYLNIV